MDDFQSILNEIIELESKKWKLILNLLSIPKKEYIDDNLFIPINKLNISNRTKLSLINLDIIFIGDIACNPSLRFGNERYGDFEKLRHAPRLGNKSLSEIKECLKQFNIESFVKFDDYLIHRYKITGEEYTFLPF